jgi:hypothetical protein
MTSNFPNARAAFAISSGLLAGESFQIDARALKRSSVFRTISSITLEALLESFVLTAKPYSAALSDLNIHSK